MSVRKLLKLGYKKHSKNIYYKVRWIGSEKIAFIVEVKRGKIRFYCESKVKENWLHNRLVEEEVRRLRWEGLKPDFPKPVFRGGFIVGKYGVKVQDGYCAICGRDFSSDGYFCSDECREEHERGRDYLFKECERCEVCGAYVSDVLYGQEGIERKIVHHVSYKPEKTMVVCPSCHLKIHRSNRYPYLKPKKRKKRGMKR